MIVIENRFWKIIVGFCFLLMICGAISLPFLYESQTLWYKFGLEKQILRGAKIAGIIGVILFLTQLLVAIRLPFFVEVYGIAKLMQFHRINGVIVLLFALSHVALMLIPEGLSNMPTGWASWPEYVGLLLLVLLIVNVLASTFRKSLTVSYKLWRAMHKSTAYVMFILLAIHTLNVSETFDFTLPRIVFYMSFSTVLLGLMIQSLPRITK